MGLFSDVLQEDELKKQKLADILSLQKRELAHTKDLPHKTFKTPEKHTEIDIDDNVKLNLNF